MSGGSNTARTMAQQALKLKSMTKLRQVVRPSSSNKTTTISNMGYQMLDLLRYVPTTIMNKIQGGFTISPPTGSPGSGTGENIPDTQTKKSPESASAPAPAPAVVSPDPDTKIAIEPLVDQVDKEIVKATPLPLPMPSPLDPIPPTPTPPPPSPGPVESKPKGLESSDKTEEEGSGTDDEFGNWYLLESRTRHLVSVLQKNLGLDTSRNVAHHVDSLYLHIYQHHEMRNTAVDAGAIQILKKILKAHKREVFIANRTRELLSLLGCNPPIKGRGVRILSIDGGGVRGLVALEVLRLLESVTGRRTHELFDYICGVSTGSILAFLVGAHRKTLDEAENLYKEMSQEIFAQNTFSGTAGLLWSHSYYHTGTFENILKKHVGDFPLISHARDPDLPRVSAISTLVNHERVTPYVFRTYTLPIGTRARYPGGCRNDMWEAVRASAAAPSYFEEIKLGRNIHQDGGIMVNNPTSVAISEAKGLWKGNYLQSVVSLGTGITMTADPNFSDIFSTPDVQSEGIRSLSWKGKFLKVLDSATDTESVHYTLKELLPNEVYFRFNPYLTDVIGLDEVNTQKLNQLQNETREYLVRNIDRVHLLSETLVKEKTIAGRFTDWWNY